MKITYLSSPITSQYGGGEKFLDDFTTGIEAEHEFIGSSKAVFDLFQSKGYKATLTSGLLEPVSPKNFLLIPISILVGLFQFIRYYKTFKDSDWIISPTSHCETFFMIPWIKLFLGKQVLFMVHAPKVPKLFSIPPLNFILSKCWGNSPVVFVSNSQKELWNEKGCNSKNQIVIYNGVKVSEFSEICGGQIPLVKDWCKQGLPAVASAQKGCSEADGVFAVEVLNPPDGIFRSSWRGSSLGDPDLHFLLAQDDRNLGDVKNKTLKIGFLARLHKEKGCDVLINALEHIKSTQSIEVVIAGDGPEKNNLIELLASKKITENIKVNFTGFQSDTKSFYESLDLLVFPSRREGFSLVLLEAWESHLSVLTSNIKPFIEAKNFQTKLDQSLIFEMDNSQDLANKIDYFIENQSTYLNSVYKQTLHDVIVNRFSSERMTDEYEKVLNFDVSPTGEAG
jgi:glycosyltransferase involved in cell wall biosynthesis